VYFEDSNEEIKIQSVLSHFKANDIVQTETNAS
jgi:hypothetical protein